MPHVVAAAKAAKAGTALDSFDDLEIGEAGLLGGLLGWIEHTVRHRDEPRPEPPLPSWLKDLNPVDRGVWLHDQIEAAHAEHQDHMNGKHPITPVPLTWREKLWGRKTYGTPGDNQWGR